jgi:hypothetical protein
MPEPTKPPNLEVIGSETSQFQVPDRADELTAKEEAENKDGGKNSPPRSI